MQFLAGGAERMRHVTERAHPSTDGRSRRWPRRHGANSPVCDQRSACLPVVAGPARLLVVLFTPASAVAEAFSREAGETASAPTLAPAALPLERLIAAAQRTGFQVVGPPPFGASPA